MTATGSEVVLDPSILDRLRRIGGQEFLVEMIDLFLENAPARVESARAAMKDGDLKGVYRAAHSLKSTAGNLGARALQAAAERLEGCAAVQDAVALPPLVEEMALRYDEVGAELRAERARLGLD